MTSVQVKAPPKPLAVGRQMHPRRRAGVIVLVVAASAASLYVSDPADLSGWAVCPFYVATGFHCAGCGTMRGLHVLLHGDVVGAVGFNPLTMLLLPVFAYPFLSNVRLLVQGRPLPKVALPGASIWVLLVVVLAFWVLRNIPVYPLTLLAP